MARKAYGVTLGQSLPGGVYNTSSTGVTTPSAATGTVATLAETVDTAVGVLVADGAAPTEAHVTDLVAAWTPLLAAITAANAAASPANAYLDIDLAVVTNQNAVRAVLRTLERTVAGSGLATG